MLHVQFTVKTTHALALKQLCGLQKSKSLPPASQTLCNYNLAIEILNKSHAPSIHEPTYSIARPPQFPRTSATLPCAVLLRVAIHCMGGERIHR